MNAVVGIAVFVAFVVLMAWLHSRFSLRRRLDAEQQMATGEEARTLREVQRDIDRGKSASQGFIPF